MQAAIIPASLLSIFDIAISPCLRVAPVKIFSGPNAGSYAVNTAILQSCDEWRAVKAQADALTTAHGIQTVDLDPACLRDPASVLPAPAAH